MANQSTQYVLRLQHPEHKCGPFRTANFPELWIATQPIRDWGDYTSLPTALCDIEGLDLWDENYVCGVEFISQFIDWFGPHYQLLLAIGFKLHMYLMPKDKVLFSKSKRQVAFDPADAIEVTVL